MQKVDAAESRRSEVHRKLLEHVAAALTLQNSGSSPPVNEQTPPISPDSENDYFNRQRKDVQSIKIYAGEGVAALLAEIDKEIGFAGDPITPVI